MSLQSGRALLDKRQPGAIYRAVGSKVHVQMVNTVPKDPTSGDVGAGGQLEGLWT